MSRYVAYFRVSTEKQGRSGLGLAAQRSAIERFLSVNDTLIASFVEVQSGKSENRNELWNAIKCAKRNNAKILIAKLDRFSRKVSFIARVMEEGVGLVVAELPNATDFQLHIFAALAQEERRLISERTRNALAEAKSRGVKLGQNGKLLAALHKAEADKRAKAMWPHIEPLLAAGNSLSEIARQLNALGLRTHQGKRFRPQQIKNIISRC